MKSTLLAGVIALVAVGANAQVSKPVTRTDAIAGQRKYCMASISCHVSHEHE